MPRRTSPKVRRISCLLTMECFRLLEEQADYEGCRSLTAMIERAIRHYCLQSPFASNKEAEPAKLPASKLRSRSPRKLPIGHLPADRKRAS